jgi:dihydroorotase
MAGQRKAYVNAHILSPRQGLDGMGGLLFEDGWILAVGAQVTRNSLGSNTDVVDCKGKHILPGLVDMRVFTGEPGAEYRESLASASEAAAAGGVTTMIVMPDTKPVIDDAAIVDYVLRRARDTALVRVAPMAAMTRGLAGDAISEIGLLKAAGAVAVTDPRRSLANAALLRRAMTYARDFNMLIVAHVEEPAGTRPAPGGNDGCAIPRGPVVLRGLA